MSAVLESSAALYSADQNLFYKILVELPPGYLVLRSVESRCGVMFNMFLLVQRTKLNTCTYILMSKEKQVKRNKSLVKI